MKPEPEKIIEIPLYAAFNLCAPRPIAVLTTMHYTKLSAYCIHRAKQKMGVKSAPIDYDGIDYDAAPMSTLTLQGKRPRNHKGPFEKGGPPVHVVSITGTRKTYRNLLDIKETVANFLWPRQGDADRMYVLSNGSYDNGNAKIKDSGLTLEPSMKVSVPRIAEAMAWIEYKLIRKIDIPESERPIFLLEPVAAYCLEGLVDPKTYAYNTENVPLGQLSANICSGGLNGIIIAKRGSDRKGFTPPEHWAYSDGLK